MQREDYYITLRRCSGGKFNADPTAYEFEIMSCRIAFRQRRNMLQTDTWLEDALSFAGPGAEF